MTRCTLCDGACDNADLRPLLAPELAWLWTQIADAADRRGDAHMTDGTLTVTLPADPAARAHATGLISNRPLTSGRKRIDLPFLTSQLQRRGTLLTPGAVAAHHRRAPLAQRSAAATARREREQELRPALAALTRHPALQAANPDALWEALRRTGWIARLHAQLDADGLVAAADRVLQALPPPDARADRRRVAEAATGDPHALDEGTVLAGLVLAVLTVTGVAPTGSRTRAAWSAAGIDLDDLTGGLLTLGLRPAGWTVPHDAVITLPPRLLSTVHWAPPPRPGRTVFITENPSVIAAASELGAEVFVVCTAGTPAATEIQALSRLTDIGWQVRVRADFDVAGIDHVRALLAGIPGARPWRMTTADYEHHLRTDLVRIGLHAAVAQTPWDPELRRTMDKHGAAVFEETLLEELLTDLGREAVGDR